MSAATDDGIAAREDRIGMADGRSPAEQLARLNTYPTAENIRQADAWA